MRGLSKEFLDAMRRKLDHGRRCGRVGWDRHWENTVFPCPPDQLMMERLHQEIDELVVALHEGNPKKILHEAADVANFAMFIADLNQ